MTVNESYETIVIGTGCAGYNAADWLYDLGHKNIAILTEGEKMGTSRNTGSDKQTYYKLSLTSDGGDSVREMAETLFAGGAMHGDTALIEAACSVKSFIKLALLGVPFPTNEYGEYVGYKTDHDPKQRATSCGPMTSKLMTEALERTVKSKKIPVIDNKQVIKLFTDDNRITGLAAIDTNDFTYHVYHCDNIILATGGPAGLYAHSVYPESQTGATGLALEAGAEAQNLCEWQYGLASVKFRWNVSGTYQQVLPRYISVDANGNEHEFLADINMVFLKGYQWPFDIRKIEGSSSVDIAVHKEISQGKRVFMDFRSNPRGLEQGFNSLNTETRQYLQNSGALFGTPIERLAKMNPAAIELYGNNGIDLWKEPLEAAVCAQHCNGGIAVNANWESSVKGLYVIGEAAGTHGIYRPGGSALNAGQAGGMRAAEHIARKVKSREHTNAFKAANTLHWTSPVKLSSISNVKEKRFDIQHKMSQHAVFIRNIGRMKEMRTEAARIKECFWQEVTVKDKTELPFIYKSYDLLVTQIAVLSAMIFSAEAIGSRGSCYAEDTNGIGGVNGKDVVITQHDISRFEPARPVPSSGGWFETVWRDFEERRRLTVPQTP
ncbi:MAG: FAD-binding protein [Defluviitaleaceae bacterium]|nr:FAD-binding protein [Defluviitaleaceae bacterium]